MVLSLETVVPENLPGEVETAEEMASLEHGAIGSALNA
jgi:hypothetical protein